MRILAFPVVLIACALAIGCTSPEATRVRGGRGADVGNRDQVVKIHAGAEPFYETPRRVDPHGPLDSARQAEQLSRQ
jgi:hypothetical protein